MIKKKSSFDFKNPLVWGSAIVSIGIIFTFFTKVVDFFRLPEALASTNEKVSELEKSEEQVAKVLERQQIINDYIHKKEAKVDKDPILSPDGRSYFDEDTKTWKKVIK